MPAAMMALTRGGGVVDRVEVEQQRAHRRRVRREAHGDPWWRCRACPRCRRTRRAGRSPAARDRRHRAPAISPSGSTTSMASDVRRRDPRTRGSAGRRSCWPRCRRSSSSAGSTDRERSAGRDGATALVRSRLSTPGSTQATPFVEIDDRIRFILVVTMTTGRRRAARPRRRARCPHPGDERPPVAARQPHARLHVGGRQREAHRRRPCRAASIEASLRYSPSSSGSARTRSEPSAATKSTTRSVARIHVGGLRARPSHRADRAPVKCRPPCPARPRRKTCTSGCRSRIPTKSARGCST